jgi:hypothetical protein
MIGKTFKKLVYGIKTRWHESGKRQEVLAVDHRVELVRGGEGRPLLFLHSLLGETRWLPFHQKLAESFDVVAPAHPGFGTTEGLGAIDGVEEVQGRKAYHIVTSARSAPFFDTFYKVRDINESWMDTESLCSLKYCSRIDENNYKKTETIILDHEKGQYQAVEEKKSGPIPLWVQDVLSSLYYLRTKDLEVGKSVMVDAHSGDKAWPLKVNVLRKEKVKVPAGEFECFVVEPVIREGTGIFQAKGKLWVWMTADKKKIPVLMRSKIAVGSIEALLTEKKMP